MGTPGSCYLILFVVVFNTCKAKLRPLSETPAPVTQCLFLELSVQGTLEPPPKLRDFSTNWSIPPSQSFGSQVWIKSFSEQLGPRSGSNPSLSCSVPGLDRILLWAAQKYQHQWKQLALLCLRKPACPCSRILPWNVSWSDILYINFSFFFFFRVPHAAYGSSWVRGRIRATAAILRYSHSNTGSEPHLIPTPQLTAMLDR